MKRQAVLDTKQKQLAKRILDFRQKLLRAGGEKRRDVQLERSFKDFEGTIAMLRKVVKKLVRYDNRLFSDVGNIIKSLQGDLSTGL